MAGGGQEDHGRLMLFAGVVHYTPDMLHLPHSLPSAQSGAFQEQRRWCATSGGSGVDKAGPGHHYFAGKASFEADGHVIQCVYQHGLTTMMLPYLLARCVTASNHWFRRS